MRSNASERRSVDDPSFNDVYGGQSKPVYDKDILSMPVYDELVYNEDIFSIPVYDKPVYDEDIFYDVVDTVKFDVNVVDLGIAVVGGTTENGYEKVIEEEVPLEPVGLESGVGVEKDVVTKEFGVDRHNSFQLWAAINAIGQLSTDLGPVCKFSSISMCCLQLWMISKILECRFQSKW